MPHPRLEVASVRAARLARQGLTKPIRRRSAFEAIFRRLQPVSTGALVRPGSPPRLAYRTQFDAERAADALRSTRRLVKGRFQGGDVGYVHALDLALYANAFRRPLGTLTGVHRQVYEAVRVGGPLTSSLIKTETGLLKKTINPALHRLQEAFLVYEDQVDDNWERGWYHFATEWPEVDLGAAVDACGVVMIRFLDAFVFATDEQLGDWTQWPRSRVARVIAGLHDAGSIVPVEVDGLGVGWCRPADLRLPAAVPPTRVVLLDRSDFVARAQRSELLRRFGRTDVLQYVYRAGAFVGAVRGHWGFKPFDIDDVVMELSAAEAAEHRAEVVRLVRSAYPAPRHRVRRYAGRVL